MRNINLKKLLTENKIDGLLITNPINIYYLTGFKGISPTEREAILILKNPKSTLITAKLYQAEANKVKSNNLEVKIAAERDQYQEFIKSSLSNIKTLGFESQNLTFSEYKSFKKLAKTSKFTPAKNLIEEIRMTKQQDELEYIKKAQLITQKAFEEILKTIKIDQTEAEIAEILISVMKSLGSEGVAFDPIVASGPNSAVPHHTTSNRKLKRGDTLLFDFGAKYKNYCADFSRTIFLGRANSKQLHIYNLVFKSQQTALKRISPGIKSKLVFQSTYEVFKKENQEEYFIHSLGHGIGLEVHEKPSLSLKSKDKLTSGSIFSIEPGLYYPWGGIRIEDLVAVEGDSVKFIGKESSLIELFT